MQEFEKRYKALNANQKKAVDTIDGPVMVVAGPGTGKTELLSVRVANILKKTDTLPQNILCLTFTESGAVAMRERLAGLLGPDAYKVAIHTFHSFGSEIINQFGEYFYQGAHFRPADELSSYQVLTDILQKLSHDNLLASTMNGDFTYLRDIQTSISELKRSGLTPDEFDKVLGRNDQFISWFQPKLNDTFGAKLSKKTIPLVDSLLGELETYTEEPLELIGYVPLHELIHESLRVANEEAVSTDSTKPLSAWKKTYVEKNAEGEPTLKDEKRCRKLHALSAIYYDYLVSMQEHELYDYDDMILRTVHALEVFNELRFSLQETYQYILVDEFQDTNDAQMRLVWNLTNNPTSEGHPNLMVVGDDDQAIYRFQGALLSNILDFTTRYSDVQIVTLTDNYRSHEDILRVARSIIVQGDERLENTLEGIDKTLTPHRESTQPLVAQHRYESTIEEHHALAELIAADSKTNPADTRAVIARNHRQLVALMPHLQAAGLPLHYERQEDVLDSEPVKQLELTARAVHALASQQHELANQLVAELLAHPAWNIPPMELWQLSLKAHREHVSWLEVMTTSSGKIRDIAEWLLGAAQQSHHQPLEYMLDFIFGVVDEQLPDTTGEEEGDISAASVEKFVSPLRNYFFTENILEKQPGTYLAYLSALQKIRAALRDYRPDKTLTLEDFVEFIDLHHRLELPIQGHGEVETGQNPVILLSAHKAKGLEFDTVYITDAQNNIWGAGARRRGRLISFPSNLPLSPVGENDDERLRLLYVAVTRARDQLVLFCARTNDGGKELLPIGSISEDELTITEHDAFDAPNAITATEHDWRSVFLSVGETDKQHLLAPLLETYKLSPTHLNNFLNVARGGPELFLLHNLLRFPQAKSPDAGYGSAIHATLQRAHQHLLATGEQRPVEDVLHDFEANLQTCQMSADDFTKYLQRGSDALHSFLDQRYDSFSQTQSTERSFSGDAIHIDGAFATGIIDLVDIDKATKTVFVTDYKTGKAVRTWQGRTDYEKIKLHHYEQQLMFYKLLVERSRQFSGYTVSGARIEFVEPDASGKIILLDYTYDNKKLIEFERLVSKVWHRICSLDFSLGRDYDASIKGILEFESDLLEK